jgi:YfiH family protein
MLSGPAAGQSGSVRWRFTDRSGGFSTGPYESLNLGSHVGDELATVIRNREQLQVALGGTSGLATMRPSHGKAVATVSSAAEIIEVDALVSSTPGVALLALGADCAPMLIFDAMGGVVAAVHVGWLGLRDDVVGAAIDRMVELGADRARLHALIGPTICGSCYAVPAERAEQVAQTVPAAVGRARSGQPSIDVRRGLSVGLIERGVTVTEIGGCTAEDRSFFSFRRDGVTGRHGAIVVIAQT